MGVGLVSLGACVGAVVMGLVAAGARGDELMLANRAGYKQGYRVGYHEAVERFVGVGRNVVAEMQTEGDMLAQWGGCYTRPEEPAA